MAIHKSLPSLADPENLALSGAVLCLDHFAKEDLEDFFNKSKDFGTRRPWGLLAKGKWKYERISFRINQGSQFMHRV